MFLFVLAYENMLEQREMCLFQWCVMVALRPPREVCEAHLHQA